MPAGRKSSYRKTFVRRATEMCKLGATDVELAAAFEVTTRTLYTWQIKHPEFATAMKVGKSEANERVVRSLYQRALGFTGPDDKYYPPDTGSMCFWLKNRAQWRDSKQLDIRRVDDMSEEECLEFLGGEPPIIELEATESSAGDPPVGNA